jgi:N-acyl-D-amino-acid deacylase
MTPIRASGRGTIPRMATFDLLVRGGTVIDGTGSPGMRADVGVEGDRIVAIGDLAAVDETTVAQVIDVTGHVVAPGFIDPHGHSDGSVLVDGALASHLHQGFTTQLSGNCGESLAPVTDVGREIIDLALRPNDLEAQWTTFAQYLDHIERQTLGPNVAFLVGHGTVRGSVIGAEARAATPPELAAMIREIEAALDAGAFGLSSGLIYAPGMHATAAEVEPLVAVTARRGGLYATHMRNESDGLFEALDESIAAVRAAGSGARLQVSHLKCGSKTVWGRAGDAIERLEAARNEGLDGAADQYPYTAAATTLAIILPPGLLGLGVEACVAALTDSRTRESIRTEMARGISGWENVARDPGWSGIVISSAASPREWVGSSIADIADEAGGDPADVAFDALVDDRLDVQIVLECMSEPDVETIMAVPWIAVCTDAEGRRPGHPILDAGKPHPRTYGSTARVLGTYARERGMIPLETAIAKMTSVPAERLGLRDRGIIREGSFADIVVFDPETVAPGATYLEPARYPIGMPHVIVNGRPAILDGVETGDPHGRLLRRA